MKMGGLACGEHRRQPAKSDPRFWPWWSLNSAVTRSTNLGRIEECLSRSQKLATF
jgi:hypothetical protein